MATTAADQRAGAASDFAARARRIRATGIQPMTEAGGMRWQVPGIMLLLAFWEGFPFSTMGMPMVFGYQLFAAIVFASMFYYIARLLRGTLLLQAWDGVAILAFLWCFIVSFHYSVFIQPQPVFGWLPAIFSTTPLLLICVLKAIGARRRDAEDALFWTGLLGTLLIIFDLTTHLGFLDVYARGSSFSEGRIVLFKWPTVFAVVIGALRATTARGLGRRFMYGLATMLLLYNVIMLAESRLAMLALALAALPIYIFCLRGTTRIVTGVAIPILAVPLIFFVIDRFFADFTGVADYLRNDVSASFRNWEIEYFGRAFNGTYGMGFGFMSGDPQYDNVLNFLHYKAGYLVGTGTYGMELVDITIYAALYQYGYVGLAIVILMTLMMGYVLADSWRLGRDYRAASACGFLALFYHVSPLPMNFFTIFATSHVGALLWFMASRIAVESRQEAMNSFAAAETTEEIVETPVGRVTGRAGT
jgi:hypothetical protein